MFIGIFVYDFVILIRGVDSDLSINGNKFNNVEVLFVICFCDLMVNVKDVVLIILIDEIKKKIGIVMVINGVFKRRVMSRIVFVVIEIFSFIFKNVCFEM